MKNLLALTLAFVLAALVLLGPAEAKHTVAAPQSIAGASRLLGCGCPSPTYLRASSSVTLDAEGYVEVDNDAGLPITITMPAAPPALHRVEVWLTSQASSAPVDVNPNGQAVTFTGGADLQLTTANEGLVFLFVRPTPSGGGYWRASPL